MLKQSVDWLREPNMQAVRARGWTPTSPEKKRMAFAHIKEEEADFWRPGSGAETICELCGWNYKEKHKVLVREGLFRRSHAVV